MGLDLDPCDVGIALLKINKAVKGIEYRPVKHANIDRVVDLRDGRLVPGGFKCC